MQLFLKDLTIFNPLKMLLENLKNIFLENFENK